MAGVAASFVLVLGCCVMRKVFISRSIELLAVVITGFAAGMGTAVGGHFTAWVGPQHSVTSR